jgi:hypothetical protein
MKRLVNSLHVMIDHELDQRLAQTALVERESVSAIVRSLLMRALADQERTDASRTRVKVSRPSAG